MEGKDAQNEVDRLQLEADTQEDQYRSIQPNSKNEGPKNSSKASRSRSWSRHRSEGWKRGRAKRKKRRQTGGVYSLAKHQWYSLLSCWHRPNKSGMNWMHVHQFCAPMQGILRPRLKDNRLNYWWVWMRTTLGRSINLQPACLDQWMWRVHHMQFVGMNLVWGIIRATIRLSADTLLALANR